MSRLPVEPKQPNRSGAFAALAALALLAGCARPTSDPAVLKAVETESKLLMAGWRPGTDGAIPRTSWPRVIASLEPQMVTVRPDGVDIMVKPGFDGGWGYFVLADEREKPGPAGRFSRLGGGVYWYHPY